MIVLLALTASQASAVYLADSKDWKDVYSVMLLAARNGEKGVFLNSESIASAAKLLPADQQIEVYESATDPMIAGVESQFASAGYNVATRQKADNFNLILAPPSKVIYLVSEENFKLTVPLASLAVNQDGWVYILNPDNAAQVAARLQGASNVVAVGNFRRDVLAIVEPYITETINNNNIYKDSEDLAAKFPDLTNVILADGTTLESEFFSTKNAVLLTGPNKILDETYNFLVQHNTKSVVLVGNALSVVGEQIRSRSNKQISVFVKFGYGNTAEGEKVYALSMFPLPQPTLGLTVTKAAYDPQAQKLVITFKNVGSGGVYELSTLSVMDGSGQEIASATDSGTTFLGAGEIMPISYSPGDASYPLSNAIPLDRIDANTTVQFYTSYGLEPTELDSFLTMENRYGPPFSIALEVETQASDNLLLNVTDVAYYSNLKRVGVTLENPTTSTIFYSVKVQRLIVNGIATDLYTEGDIAAGQTKTAYMPVELDSVDLEENQVFDLTVLYGGSSDLKTHIYRPSPLPAFQVKQGSSGLTGFLVGVPSAVASPIGIVVLALIVAVVIVIVVVRRRR